MQSVPQHVASSSPHVVEPTKRELQGRRSVVELTATSNTGQKKKGRAGAHFCEKGSALSELSSGPSSAWERVGRISAELELCLCFLGACLASARVGRPRQTRASCSSKASDRDRTSSLDLRMTSSNFPAPWLRRPRHRQRGRSPAPKHPRRFSGKQCTADRRPPAASRGS